MIVDEPAMRDVVEGGMRCCGWGKDDRGGNNEGARGSATMPQRVYLLKHILLLLTQSET